MSPHAVATSDPVDPDRMLRAIAEPRRRAILALVSGRERSAGDIAAEFEITRPAVSQHLTVLKEAGLLEERRDGTRRLYRSRREALDELRHALESIWRGPLERGKALAEESS